MTEFIKKVDRNSGFSVVLSADVMGQHGVSVGDVASFVVSERNNGNVVLSKSISVASLGDDIYIDITQNDFATAALFENGKVYDYKIMVLGGDDAESNPLVKYYNKCKVIVNEVFGTGNSFTVSLRFVVDGKFVDDGNSVKTFDVRASENFIIPEEMTLPSDVRTFGFDVEKSREFMQDGSLITLDHDVLLWKNGSGSSETHAKYMSSGSSEWFEIGSDELLDGKEDWHLGMGNYWNFGLKFRFIQPDYVNGHEYLLNGLAGKEYYGSIYSSLYLISETSEMSDIVNFENGIEFITDDVPQIHCGPTKYLSVVKETLEGSDTSDANWTLFREDFYELMETYAFYVSHMRLGGTEKAVEIADNIEDFTINPNEDFIERLKVLNRKYVPVDDSEYISNRDIFILNALVRHKMVTVKFMLPDNITWRDSVPLLEKEFKFAELTGHTLVFQTFLYGVLNKCGNSLYHYENGGNHCKCAGMIVGNYNADGYGYSVSNDTLSRFYYEESRFIPPLLGRDFTFDIIVNNIKFENGKRVLELWPVWKSIFHETFDSESSSSLSDEVASVPMVAFGNMYIKMQQLSAKKIGYDGVPFGNVVTLWGNQKTIDAIYNRDGTMYANSMRFDGFGCPGFQSVNAGSDTVIVACDTVQYHTCTREGAEQNDFSAVEQYATEIYSGCQYERCTFNINPKKYNSTALKKYRNDYGSLLSGGISFVSRFFRCKKLESFVVNSKITSLTGPCFWKVKCDLELYGNSVDEIMKMAVLPTATGQLYNTSLDEIDIATSRTNYSFWGLGDYKEHKDVLGNLDGTYDEIFPVVKCRDGDITCTGGMWGYNTTWEITRMYTLDSIVIRENPAKMFYHVDESFDITGMEVWAKYVYEESQTDIRWGRLTPAEYSVTDLTPAKGEQTIVISFADAHDPSNVKTARLKVTVIDGDTIKYDVMIKHIGDQSVVDDKNFEMSDFDISNVTEEFPYE